MRGEHIAHLCSRGRRSWRRDQGCGLAILLLVAAVVTIACGSDSIDPQERIVEAHVKLLERDTVGFKRERVNLISGKAVTDQRQTDLTRNVTFSQPDDGLSTLLMQEDVYVLIASSTWQYAGKAPLPASQFRWLMPIAEWDYDVEVLADDTLDGEAVERYRGTTQWEGFRVRGFQEFEASLRKEDGELVAIRWVEIITHGYDLGSFGEFSRNVCTGSGLRVVVQEEFVEDDFFEYVRGELTDSQPLAAKCVEGNGAVVSEWTSLAATRVSYTVTRYNEPLDTPIPLPPRGYQVPPDEQQVK